MALFELFIERQCQENSLSSPSKCKFWQNSQEQMLNTPTDDGLLKVTTYRYRHNGWKFHCFKPSPCINETGPHNVFLIRSGQNFSSVLWFMTWGHWIKPSKFLIFHVTYSDYESGNLKYLDPNNSNLPISKLSGSLRPASFSYFEKQLFYMAQLLVTQQKSGKPVS